MIKKAFSLFIFLLSVSFLQAQLLWKITGNGLKKTSYLFGTHHMIPINFLDSVPGLYKAFNSCNQVVGEMVMNNVDAMAKIQQAAIMPGHIRMKDLLGEDEYVLVDNELKSVLKFGLKELSIMNPALIVIMYQMELYKKQTGHTENKQSDSYFQLVAAEKGNKVVGLESIDQQIEILFGNTSYQRQADILVQSIVHKDSMMIEMMHMYKLYKAGKMDELVKQSQKRDKLTDMTDAEYAKLVEDRNVAWTRKLPALMNETPSFIAVGALHLGGENGLVKLLQKAGYKVKEVTSNP
jgi:uncharacterized protein YbaP (TraB family)